MLISVFYVYTQSDIGRERERNSSLTIVDRSF